uniref:Uncharacterized protein n=1 Tax=Streptomyces avermitilis TaxID=33903 RepID=A0A499VBW0_STRAX|nr:hypothetical protein SAVMC3_46040 [Streptomyces avermitilis]
MQSDGGLAGARGALHTDGGGEVGAYEVVLFGLDGGGDVTHGAEPGAFDLVGEDAAGGVLFGADVLVLQAGEIGGVTAAAGRPAEAAADGDALGARALAW